MKILTFCLALIVMTCTLASGQTYKVLYNFGGIPNDAAYPYGLIADKAGNLYGVGGGGAAQEGSVFELSPQAGPPRVSISSARS